MTPSITLKNGVRIPIIGCGASKMSRASTMTSSERPTPKRWLLSALQVGYRHIDTARGYNTEEAVGEAIKESGIPREDIFVTTKLQWNHHDRVEKSFEESLKALQLDYVDLYLIHWPQFVVLDSDGKPVKNVDGVWQTRDDVTINDVWAKMEALYDAGMARSIGVSNFSIKTLKQLLTTARVMPVVNQVEMHPYLAQNSLKRFCAELGIAMGAYTPSGYNEVRSDPIIVGLAKKYGVTANQVILSWHVHRETIIVPKSENPIRQKENLSIIELEDGDIAKIDALDRNQRICNKMDETGTLFGWTYEQYGW